MVKSINGQKGTIDQTKFKTMQEYGFDSLVVETNQLQAIRMYIDHIRIRLTPQCDYVLITRAGKQLSQLSSILGNFVYDAIGKYVHPTRLRQIIETDSAKYLSMEQQAIISEDQKHSSHVAKVHYKKLRSRDVAIKAKAALATLTTPPNCSLTSLPSFKTISTNSKVAEGMECEEETSTCQMAPIVSTEVKVEEEAISERAKRTFFTKTEDTFLINGIKKHGWGNWTSILRDRRYRFDEKRTPQTLHRRATLKKMNLI